MKLISPFLFLIIAISVFFFIVIPTFNDVRELRSNKLVYGEALNNSKELKDIQDSLFKKYKDIAKEDKDKLDNFLPTSVKYIDLILEIEKIANNKGILVKNIVFSTEQEKQEVVKITESNKVLPSPKKEGVSHEIFSVDFTVDTTYDNFVLFLKDLEYNLRLIDVKSISFSIPEKSDKTAKIEGSDGININPNIYSYKLTIETYWFK